MYKNFFIFKEDNICMVPDSQSFLQTETLIILYQNSDHKSFSRHHCLKSGYVCKKSSSTYSKLKFLPLYFNSNLLLCLIDSDVESFPFCSSLKVQPGNSFLVQPQIAGVQPPPPLQTKVPPPCPSLLTYQPPSPTTQFTWALRAGGAPTISKTNVVVSAGKGR